MERARDQSRVKGKGYEIAHMCQGTQKEHPYGEIFELLKNPYANIALIKINDDREHYHKKATEFYYIIKGTGTIKLNNSNYFLGPGTCIRIDPETRHKAKADIGELEILVVSTPPYDPDDEFPTEA